MDADVDVHNTSEVLFHLTANTDPQRDSLFTKGPSDVLDHAASEIAPPREIRHGTGEQGKSRQDYLTGRGFKRPWPPLIKMDESVRNKTTILFGNAGDKI